MQKKPNPTDTGPLDSSAPFHLKNKPEKILIRAVNWIGDAVLTIPAIRSIRNSYPDAHISLLAKPWTADIFKACSYIDEIIPYEEHHTGLIGKLRLAKLLRQKKFDTAILLQNAFDAALISWLSGIPERIGYKRDGRGILLTKAVPVEQDILSKHQVYYYLDLLNKAGINTFDELPYINLTDDERSWAGNLISSSFPGENPPVFGINPGATYGSAKRWPPEQFAELIVDIIEDLSGRIIIFGSKAETEIADEIISEIRKAGKKSTESHILVMSGKTNLRELASLIAACNVFITNDSGPMHMAAALAVPTVAIFGSTNKHTTAPFGNGHRVISKDISCAPCMKRECPEGDVKCMTEITAREVFQAVKEIMPNSRAVFLDKDGTLIIDKNYLNTFDDLVILPGVKDSLQKLKGAGFKLIGITNQSGIARGVVDEKFVQDSNKYLQEKLGMDDIYYCPHHPEDKCFCRKPEPLMALRARLTHGIDLKKSYVIGDRESDVLVAKKIGATGVLLSSTPLFEDSRASCIAKDLKDAVKWILESATSKKTGL